MFVKEGVSDSLRSGNAGAEKAVVDSQCRAIKRESGGGSTNSPIQHT